MKKNLCILAFALFSAFSYAQTGFQVNETSLTYDVPDPDEVEQILKTYVKNTSGATTVFRWVRRTICMDTLAYGNSVCIGLNCFEQTTETKTFELAAGEETELSMHLWRNAAGSPLATIEVDLFPDAQPTNSVTVKFYYGVCTSGTTAPGSFEALEVFPNPSTQYVQVLNAEDASQVRLYDMTGALLLSHDLSTGNQIDLSGLNSGLYSLRISDVSGARNSIRVITKQ
jgi:hypothetical protein